MTIEKCEDLFQGLFALSLYLGILGIKVCLFT